MLETQKDVKHKKVRRVHFSEMLSNCWISLENFGSTMLTMYMLGVHTIAAQSSRGNPPLVAQRGVVSEVKMFGLDVLQLKDLSSQFVFSLPQTSTSFPSNLAERERCPADIDPAS